MQEPSLLVDIVVFLKNRLQKLKYTHSFAPRIPSLFTTHEDLSYYVSSHPAASRHILRDRV
jgi:hypothetical protein